MDLKEEAILGGSVATHWYYVSKAAALLRLVRPLSFEDILDVGAGSGYFSRFLLEQTGASSAICVDPGYQEESDQDHAGKRISFRRSCKDSHAGLALMMDVLEHVEDDEELLRYYINQLPPGSHVVVSVPAFRFLWSSHDLFLEHKRRYRLSEVEALVRETGLEVIRGCYYFGMVFPLAAVHRLAGRLSHGSEAEPRSDLVQHGKFANWTLGAMSRVELPVFRYNRLAGLSVFCLARKP